MATIWIIDLENPEHVAQPVQTDGGPNAQTPSVSWDNKGGHQKCSHPKALDTPGERAQTLMGLPTLPLGPSEAAFQISMTISGWMGDASW